MTTGAAKIPSKWRPGCTNTAQALRTLGDRLEAGQLTDVEALGPQRHVAVLCGDEEVLGVGFTRSAVLPHIRETMKQIEAQMGVLKPSPARSKPLRPERLPNGCFTLHRGGDLVGSTLPSSFPHGRCHGNRPRRARGLSPARRRPTCRSPTSTSTTAASPSPRANCAAAR